MFYINIITKIYYKIKKDRQGNTYEKQSERRRGYIRETKKFEARRWKCVGSAPTKWIFVFAVIVAAVFLWFLLELGGNWPDFTEYAITLAKIIEYDDKILKIGLILQECSRFHESFSWNIQNSVNFGKTLTIHTYIYNIECAKTYAIWQLSYIFVI